jgi:hypothetical protein
VLEHLDRLLGRGRRVDDEAAGLEHRAVQGAGGQRVVDDERSAARPRGLCRLLGDEPVGPQDEHQIAAGHHGRTLVRGLIAQIDGQGADDELRVADDLVDRQSHRTPGRLYDHQRLAIVRRRGAPQREKRAQIPHDDEPVAVLGHFLEIGEIRGICPQSKTSRLLNEFNEMFEGGGHEQIQRLNLGQLLGVAALGQDVGHYGWANDKQKKCGGYSGDGNKF